MKKVLLAAAIAALVSGTASAEHRLGFGFHYWKTVDEIVDEGLDDADEIDDNGLSQIFSYQYVPGGLIKLEADVEYFDKGFGGSTESAYSPQVWLLVGGAIYGGVGAGMTYSSGLEDDWSDPYYAARAGFDLLLLPRFHLDLNASSRFDAWSELDDVDTETLTVGAVARFAF